MVISRRIAAPDAGRFEQWAADAISVGRRWPGFLSAGVLRPGDGDGDVHLVYRFDCASNLARWEQSPERAELLATLAPIVLDGHTRKLTGLETWFEVGDRPAIASPPKWKMAALTFVALVPQQLAFTVLVSPHLRQAVVRSVVLAASLVVLMTWVVMPRLTQVTRRWLYPQP